MLNKNLKRPGSAVLDKALEFMAAFGKDDKKLKSLLEEMKEVQVHNERVLSEVFEAKKTLAEREKGVAGALRHLQVKEENFTRDREASRVELGTEARLLYEKCEAHDQRHAAEGEDIRAAIAKNKESSKLLQYGQQQLETGKKIVEEGAHKLDVERQEFNAKRARLQSLLNQLKTIY